MRFSSALFASLAAQVVFAGGPSIPSKTGIIAVDVGLSVVGDVQSAVEAEGELVGMFAHFANRLRGSVFYTRGGAADTVAPGQ